MEGVLSPSSPRPLPVLPPPDTLPPSSDSSRLVKPLRVLPPTHRTPRQTQSFPEQQTSVLSQQQTSVLSQQQTSASAFITQHQHSASTISILWRLRQQPTSGYHEGWDIKRSCAPMVAMIPTSYGFGYSQTRMT